MKVVFNKLIDSKRRWEFYLLPCIHIFWDTEEGWNIKELTISWLFWNVFFSNDAETVKTTIKAEKI